MKFKVLLIGLGAVGMGYDYDETNPYPVLTHARAFANHEDFHLAGGVDPDTEACGRFQHRYGGWSGSDMAEGLRTVSPDVVVVASPTHFHAQAVQMALCYSKPKLILCEKPLAYSLDEARMIVSACLEVGCLLYVNYLRRVDPGVLEVKRRLQNGAICTPVKGLLWYTKGLLHNGSHFSNLLEFWLGPMKKFRLINIGRSISEVDFEPDVHVNFAAGDVTFLAARDEYFSHHEIHLIAPNGCLRYELGGANIVWQGVERDKNFPAYTVLSPHGERISTEEIRLQWHVADHVSACLHGQPSSLCSGEDALRTLQSLLEIKLPQ